MGSRGDHLHFRGERKAFMRDQISSMMKFHRMKNLGVFRVEKKASQVEKGVFLHIPQEIRWAMIDQLCVRENNNAFSHI